MWGILAVAFTGAFIGNLGAEIAAEGVADFVAQLYNDWFWSFDGEKAMADVDKHYEEVQRLIADAEKRMYLPPMQR
jgi:hypothetical protein